MRKRLIVVTERSSYLVLFVLLSISYMPPNIETTLFRLRRDVEVAEADSTLTCRGTKLPATRKFGGFWLQRSVALLHALLPDLTSCY